MKTLAIKTHMLWVQKKTQLSEARGATAVEYGLIVALIAVVVIVAVALIGTNLSTIFNRTANSINP